MNYFYCLAKMTIIQLEIFKIVIKLPITRLYLEKIVIQNHVILQFYEEEIKNIDIFITYNTFTTTTH